MSIRTTPRGTRELSHQPLLRRPAASPLIVRWIARSRALVGLPAAIAAQQLDLQVVQRVEVGKAVADAARERRIVVEQRRLPRDREHVRDRARVLGGDAREDRARAARRRRRARRSATRSRGRSWRAPWPCSTARCGRTASARASRSAARALSAPPGCSASHASTRRAEAVPARAASAGTGPS